MFRKAFNFIRDELGLDKGISPYSLRRGGATSDFRSHGSLDKTADRGRWGNVRTCRIYVNTALADQIASRFSAAVRERMNKAKAALIRL